MRLDLVTARRAALAVAALAVAAAVAAPACHRDRAPDPGAASAASAGPSAAATPAAAPAPAAEVPTLAPAELAATLAGAGAADRPLLFHVGFRSLYQQGHIPGSEYLGPGQSDAGLDQLRARVASLPKDAAIVLYCGCCPWSHCPNVRPAYAALAQLGFTRVKVLRIDHDFGEDWAAHGYPVATGD